jgi:hypothetical protein
MKTLNYLVRFNLIVIVLTFLLATKVFSQTATPRFVTESSNGDFNSCVQLLNDGLRDVYTTTNNVSLFQDSKTYFASDQFISDYHSGKWNGGISVIVDAIPIGLNAGASDDDVHRFQQRIRSSTSLTVQLQTYQTITRSTLNIELANTFNTCIENSQRFGLYIDLTASDDNVANVTIKYMPLSSDDQHPKIKSVQLVGLDDNATQSILNSTLKIGTVIPDQLSFTAYRKPKQQMVIVLNTSNGLSIVKRLDGDDESQLSTLPIGTIISSMIDFDNFNKATKNNGSINTASWSPTKSKWAPCDGRSVIGSTYYTLLINSPSTNGVASNVPDLRGVFVRGLNRFDNNEQSSAPTYQLNPDNKLIGEFQGDALQDHTHNYDRYKANVINDFSNDKDQRKGNFAPNEVESTTSVQGAKTATETRPKNRSVYYYVKIN